MKKQIIMLGIVVLLICVGLSGCEELETENPDYKYVSVSVTARVSNESVGIPNMEIYLQIFKDGVLQEGKVKITGWDGLTDSVSYVVKVYKGQRVRVVGNLNTLLPQEYLDEGYSVYDLKYETLSWDVISESTDWGETYNWAPQLYFAVTKG